MSQYIFRIDDIAPNMNWENFEKLKQIFITYNIKPIIGVIPDNKDRYLCQFPNRDKNLFWNTIRLLQNVYGWDIALHGYEHVYSTRESGILKINKRSEFAGETEEIQRNKIHSGMKLMKAEKVTICAFMAPAHSFDSITLKVLKNSNLNVITDGFGLYPYYYQDILFVPQLFSKPRRMPFGIFTFCLHINSFKDDNLLDIEKFIIKNKRNIISFSDITSNIKTTKWIKFNNYIIRKLMIFKYNFFSKKGSI